MKFTIPGAPVGKARPRVTRWGTHIEEKTVLYENLVKLSYQEQGGTYTEKPLNVAIDVFYDIPKSTPKKNIQPMLDGLIKPCKKPDVDNICKVLLDALNGIAYKDDAQVVYLLITKNYAEQARVDMKIWEY